MVSREQRLAETLVRLADTLVRDFDVVDLFHQLVESVPGLVAVEEAGLLLADGHGDLQVMAASSESVRIIELLQVHASRGPCFDAFETGEMVMSSFYDAAAVDRWPAFVESARAGGFGSILAVPMRVRGTVLGALNLFRVDREELAGEDVVAAKALADIATIAILQDRAAHDSTVLVDQLQHALNSRVIIEQAKGVLAEKMHVDMDESFALLREYARNHNLTLRKVAEDVASGTLDPDLLHVD